MMCYGKYEGKSNRVPNNPTLSYIWYTQYSVRGRSVKFSLKNLGLRRINLFINLRSNM